MVKVLRLKTGNQIKLFNNNEGEFLGTIVSINKGDISVSVDLQVREPSEDPMRFHIALSIIKGERMDYAIQKSVELGVTSVSPLYSQFSEVKIKNKNNLENKIIQSKRRGFIDLFGKISITFIDGSKVVFANTNYKMKKLC